MTEPLLEPEHSITESSIQCNLCLHDITYDLEGQTPQDKGYVICPRCEYHQPLTKGPRGRDLTVFGVTIGAVYLTTLIAVLLTR